MPGVLPCSGARAASYVSGAAFAALGAPLGRRGRSHSRGRWARTSNLGKTHSKMPSRSPHLSLLRFCSSLAPRSASRADFTGSRSSYAEGYSAEKKSSLLSRKAVSIEGKQPE